MHYVPPPPFAPSCSSHSLPSTSFAILSKLLHSVAMDLIPLEILSEIFAKLTLHDWLHCIQVCRSWRTIVPMAVDDLIICREECNRGLISQIHHFKMIRSATFRCVPAKSLCVALDRLSPCRINQLDSIYGHVSSSHWR
ncbi:hypothetical protein BX666DRAFT_583441 [Dichotomocladium elegans]|nr:hypothetical protein BX666DRAFT_583441 [Dichotomocladium elegans]